MRLERGQGKCHWKLPSRVVQMVRSLAERLCMHLSRGKRTFRGGRNIAQTERPNKRLESMGPQVAESTVIRAVVTGAWYVSLFSAWFATALTCFSRMFSLTQYRAMKCPCHGGKDKNSSLTQMLEYAYCMAASISDSRASRLPSHCFRIDPITRNF